MPSNPRFQFVGVTLSQLQASPNVRLTPSQNKSTFSFRRLFIQRSWLPRRDWRLFFSQLFPTPFLLLVYGRHCQYGTRGVFVAACLLALACQ
jgi:hypothetical protein